MEVSATIEIENEEYIELIVDVKLDYDEGYSISSYEILKEDVNNKGVFTFVTSEQEDYYKKYITEYDKDVMLVDAVNKLNDN